MLQTAAGFSMAGPMFVVGIDFLRTGRPVLGAGFLALGAVALYFPTYLLNRIGGPRTWVRRRLGRWRRDETANADGDDGSEPSSDDEGDAADSAMAPLERLRRR